MDVHSSKTTVYAVPLKESDLDMRASAEDFIRSFKNFYSGRPGYVKVASFLEGIEHFILIKNSTKSHETFWMMAGLDLIVLVARATDHFRITKSVRGRPSILPRARILHEKKNARGVQILGLPHGRQKKDDIKTNTDRLLPVSQMYDRLVNRGFPHKKRLLRQGIKCLRWSSGY